MCNHPGYDMTDEELADYRAEIKEYERKLQVKSKRARTLRKLLKQRFPKTPEVLEYLSLMDELPARLR